jgi:hypothetical protein
VDIFDDFFAVISQHAGQGAQGAGIVADWVIRAGLTAGEISAMLDLVRQRADWSPQIVNYAQQELTAAQLYHADQRRPNWIVPVAIGAVLLVWANSRN